MGVGITILYVIALVFVSGICKEIYFRGFARKFCGKVFGEITVQGDKLKNNSISLIARNEKSVCF